MRFVPKNTITPFKFEYCTVSNRHLRQHIIIVNNNYQSSIIIIRVLRIFFNTRWSDDLIRIFYLWLKIKNKILIFQSRDKSVFFMFHQRLFHDKSYLFRNETIFYLRFLMFKNNIIFLKRDQENIFCITETYRI